MAPTFAMQWRQKEDWKGKSRRGTTADPMVKKGRRGEGEGGVVGGAGWGLD